MMRAANLEDAGRRAITSGLEIVSVGPLAVGGLRTLKNLTIRCKKDGNRMIKLLSESIVKRTWSIQVLAKNLVGTWLHDYFFGHHLCHNIFCRLPREIWA